MHESDWCRDDLERAVNCSSCIHFNCQSGVTFRLAGCQRLAARRVLPGTDSNHPAKLQIPPGQPPLSLLQELFVLNHASERLSPSGCFAETTQNLNVATKIMSGVNRALSSITPDLSSACLWLQNREYQVLVGMGTHILKKSCYDR